MSGRWYVILNHTRKEERTLKLDSSKRYRLKQRAFNPDNPFIEAMLLMLMLFVATFFWVLIGEKGGVSDEGPWGRNQDSARAPRLQSSSVWLPGWSDGIDAEAVRARDYLPSGSRDGIGTAHPEAGS
jgi:hypothetical protein